MVTFRKITLSYHFVTLNMHVDVVEYILRYFYLCDILPALEQNSLQGRSSIDIVSTFHAEVSGSMSAAVNYFFSRLLISQ